MRQLCDAPDPQTLLGLRDRALLHTLERGVRKYALACGLPQIKPHDFERFVSTELAKRNLRQAQRALGHQRLETTVAHYVLDALPARAHEGAVLSAALRQEVF